MESSEDRIGADHIKFYAAMARSGSRNPGEWRIRNPWTQPHVWAPAIVMLDPRAKRCPQVSFRQRNEPVQTLSANCPDHPFAHRIGNGSQLHVIRRMECNL